jgi:hypothetical protein
MSTISRTFSAVSQATDELGVSRGRSATYQLTGTFSATLELQRRRGNGPWETVLSTTTTVASTILHAQDGDCRYRWVTTAYTSGSPAATLADRPLELEAWPANDGSKPLQINEDGVVTPQAAITLALLAGLVRLTAIETGLTAHAGGGKASALALDATKAVHVVSVIGTDADSILMPPAVVGEVHLVCNTDAAQSMQVFGAGTDTINGVATGTGVAQAAGKAGLFICVSAGAWLRILSA